MDVRVLELVEKAKNGDRQAFSQLYDEFAERLFRYIKIKVQNKEQAEDLLQESFIRAWENLRLFKLENGNFQAWIYKIASNCVNDHFRKVYRRPIITELNEKFDKSSGENVAEQVADRLETQRVLQAFELLPAGYREILELRFVQNMSLDETAKILDRTNLAIRVLQHRALKKLRQAIKEKYDDMGYSKI